MKQIKKVLCVLMAIVTICSINPVEAYAAGKLTATTAVKTINNQISKSGNFSFECYRGKIKSSNLVFSYAINTKSKIYYNDSTKMGLTKTYYYKNKMYWYNTASKKWFYQNVKKMPKTSYGKVSLKAKCTLMADKKFAGKKCIVVKVKDGDEETLYYLNKANKQWIGMESDGYIVKVNLTKKISIPANVLKAKKKTYKL